MVSTLVRQPPLRVGDARAIVHAPFAAHDALDAHDLVLHLLVARVELVDGVGDAIEQRAVVGDGHAQLEFAIDHALQHVEHFAEPRVERRRQTTTIDRGALYAFAALAIVC